MNKIIFIVIYCSTALSVIAQTERRFQVWNKNEVIIQFRKNISLDIAEKIHYSPERNSTDLKYAEIFLSQQPKNWFEYGAGFRVSKANTYPNWVKENRAMLTANLLKIYNNNNFKFSNRLEYRFFETDLHHFRYRQEFKIEFTSLTNWGMRFYISEESFCKLNGTGLHLARVYGGVSVIELKHYNLKLYYALEKYKIGENWSTTDIAGLNMSFLL